MHELDQTSSQREFRNVVPLATWTLAWLGSLALAALGPRFLWGEQPVLGWTALAVNVAVGIAWIVVHARYLRAVDELQRKIMLDAIAIAVALGAGLVGGFAYAAGSAVGLIAWEANIAIFTALMAAVYLAATAVGNLRYR